MRGGRCLPLHKPRLLKGMGKAQGIFFWILGRLGEEKPHDLNRWCFLWVGVSGVGNKKPEGGLDSEVAKLHIKRKSNGRVPSEGNRSPIGKHEGIGLEKELYGRMQKIPEGNPLFSMHIKGKIEGIKEKKLLVKWCNSP